MCVKQMCVLLLSRAVFCRCESDPIGWWCSVLPDLADFISSCSVSCCEWHLEVSNWNCGFVYFFQLYPFLLHIFWSSVWQYTFRIVLSLWWIHPYYVMFPILPSYFLLSENFLWYQYSQLLSFLINVHIKCLFLETAHIWIIFKNSLCHHLSFNLCI